MYIPNDENQNYFFCRLQLVVETFGTKLNKTNNQNSIKVPKVVKSTNKKLYYKTFGTSLNKQPNVPFLPEFLNLIL